MDSSGACSDFKKSIELGENKAKIEFNKYCK
jgi:hypothetical protein